MTRLWNRLRAWLGRPAVSAPSKPPRQRFWRPMTEDELVRMLVMWRREP